MKIVICLFLFIASFLAIAEQPPALNGVWLNRSIDSYERVTKTRNGTQEDTDNCFQLYAYIGGILAVHKQNNLMAAFLVASLNDEKSRSHDTKAIAQIEKQMRIAFAFTPLLRLPDQFPVEQSIAIVRKYLENNPQKWGAEAYLLITTALAEAFEKK